MALKTGSNVNSRANDTWTALMVAAEKDRLNIVQFLLDADVEMDARTSQGYTALLLAAWRGHLGVVRALVSHGAAVDLADAKGHTPLMMAAKTGQDDIVQYLVKQNANVDARTKNGWTALHVAVFNDQLSAVRVLLDSGATVDSADDEGFAPLMVAARKGNADMVQSLLDHQASVDATTAGGCTALRIAAAYGHLETVRVLLEEGATVDLADEAGRTPLTGARNHGHTEVVQLLEAYSRRSKRHTAKPSLREMCAAMVDGKDLCGHFLDRVEAIYHQLHLVRYPASPLSKERAKQAAPVVEMIEEIVQRFRTLLETFSKPEVDHSMTLRAVIKRLRELHCQLDNVVNDPAEPSWTHQWKVDIEALHLEASTKVEPEPEPKEQEPTQTEPIRPTPTTPELCSAVIPPTITTTRPSTLITRKIAADSAPPATESRPAALVREPSANILVNGVSGWLIPREQVEVDDQPSAWRFYGKVCRGRWLTSNVVVKCIPVDSKEEKNALIQVVQKWQSLSDTPKCHVLRCFGAYTDDKSISVVCEEALHGNLNAFLYQERCQHRLSTWRKLHQAALSLSFLHSQGIVHGELKGNNILIGQNETSMLTDFGLRAAKTTHQNKLNTLRWKAPECLQSGVEKSPPTVKSDVYSLGMCIVEAVTHKDPWTSFTGLRLADVAVKYCLLTTKEFLQRPAAFEDDAQWDLVERMCAFEPSARIELPEVLESLARFANIESAQATQRSSDWRWNKKQPIDESIE
ncbi:hypothetical protein BBJ28_00022491 [Nothophytophthora sp. Chile5]|nr:hypothetical protein BBJ28_00022491 [Nothophytophthora sp. Chile5]